MFGRIKRIKGSPSKYNQRLLNKPKPKVQKRTIPSNVDLKTIDNGKVNHIQRAIKRMQQEEKVFYFTPPTIIT